MTSDRERRPAGQLDPYDFDPDSEQAGKIELDEHLAWVRDNGTPEEKAALRELDEAPWGTPVPDILRVPTYE